MPGLTRADPDLRRREQTGQRASQPGNPASGLDCRTKRAKKQLRWRLNTNFRHKPHNKPGPLATRTAAMEEKARILPASLDNGEQCRVRPALCYISLARQSASTRFRRGGSCFTALLSPSFLLAHCWHLSHCNSATASLCAFLSFFLAFGVWLTFVPAPLVPPWGHYCSYKVSALNFLPVVLLLRHNVFCCFRLGSIFCRLIAIEVCFLWSGRA